MRTSEEAFAELAKMTAHNIEVMERIDHQLMRCAGLQPADRTRHEKEIKEIEDELERNFLLCADTQGKIEAIKSWLQEQILKLPQ